MIEVGPELVVGLIGAVGTTLKSVGLQLKQEFARVGYGMETIRLSDLLLQCHKYENLAPATGGPEDARLEALMNAGDDLRRTARRGDAMALLALNKIRQIRFDRSQYSDRALPRQAFLLHSLKHPDESRTLREIYGNAFVAVSIYTPRARRLQVLSDRISHSKGEYHPEVYEKVAAGLIAKDEKEVGDELGQNVRDTFPDADVFLDATHPAKIAEQIQRFVEILFQHPHRTPTLDEYGLFHAKAAALRSADLSRQVGAVIMTDDGEMIAAGCNEVPKAGAARFGRDGMRIRARIGVTS